MAIGVALPLFRLLALLRPHCRNGGCCNGQVVVVVEPAGALSLSLQVVICAVVVIPIIPVVSFSPAQAQHHCCLTIDKPIHQGQRTTPSARHAWQPSVLRSSLHSSLLEEGNAVDSNVDKRGP